jgi:3D (Asp-Asp-Asp) domain-containing protein
MFALVGFGFLGAINKANAGDIVPPAIQQEASKILVMRITAYSSDPAETSDHPFITASGEHVRDGIVASNALPFGTRVQIPKLFGDKIFIVEDRMNQRFQNTIDIWMQTKLAAIDFGVAHVPVIVLGNEPSPPVAEAKTVGKITL